MIRVFGITGTNGKTTASWMLRSILRQRELCGLIGTIEYQIGGARYEPVNTTPGKMVLDRLFEEMKSAGINQCVMEVSSHGLEQGRTENIHFSGAGFTNLSRDHLDYHISMEQYYQCKKKLFLQEGLYSTINIDDSYGKRLYAELVSAFGNDKIKSCSMERPEADFYGKIKKENLEGTAIDFYQEAVLLGTIQINLAGRHFAADALLAAAMARQAGTTFRSVRKGIENVRSVAGRMERVGSPEDTLGIVDYAHTPDSLEKLLETVSQMKRGKLISVFGCGGFRDKGKRLLMGDIAGRFSDFCIITNDNPRGESPGDIATMIEEGLYPTGCDYCVILDRYQAIKRAVSLADKWDIIVVAGKGHEKYQISGSETIPFDDKEVLKELLEKKYEKTYNETD